jgi:hypothetical protein
VTILLASKGLVTVLLLSVISSVGFPFFFSLCASTAIDVAFGVAGKIHTDLVTRIGNYSFLWRTPKAVRDYFRGNGLERSHLRDRNFARCYSLLWMVTVAGLREPIM